MGIRSPITSRKCRILRHGSSLSDIFCAWLDCRVSSLLTLHIMLRSVAMAGKRFWAMMRIAAPILSCCGNIATVPPFAPGLLRDVESCALDRNSPDPRSFVASSQTDPWTVRVVLERTTLRPLAPRKGGRPKKPATDLRQDGFALSA
jgi:hypothetical protein